MQDRFQGKYRILFAQLQNWNYGSDANYFITICTQSRNHYFGKINADLNLSPIGQLAAQYWLEIPKHFPFIELGNFVVMPNHMHGILTINKMGNKINEINVNGDTVETLHCNVSTPRPGSSLINPDKRDQMSKISPHAGSISTIIRSYKSVVTKYAHFMNSEFEWQSRFYDHIIRDAESFDRIQEYIENNPKNWDSDTFYQ